MMSRRPATPAPQLKAGLFARSVGPKPAKPASSGPPAPKGPSGVRIEHRIGVHAPAEVIWAVIHDLAAWGDWNPLYAKAAGAIRIGAQLEMTVTPPGQRPFDIKPTVLEWVPNEQLHWKTSSLGVRTVRFIEIEALAEASCIVSNGEYVGGFLGNSVVRRMGRSLHRGFAAMNEALKARAEARWAAERSER